MTTAMPAGTGCPELAGACAVDHATDQSGPHSAYGFTVGFCERASGRGDTVGLSAELVQWDAEPGFPRVVEVCADVDGTILELSTPADVERLRTAAYAFGQGLSTLAVRLAGQQNPGAHRGCEGLGGHYSLDHPGPPEGLDHVGPVTALGAPGDRAGEFLQAQLFQSQAQDSPPVIALWTGSVDAEVGARDARVYALQLRCMADHIEHLAARLDRITTGWRDESVGRGETATKAA